MDARVRTLVSTQAAEVYHVAFVLALRLLMMLHMDWKGKHVSCHPPSLKTSVCAGLSFSGSRGLMGNMKGGGVHGQAPAIEHHQPPTQFAPTDCGSPGTQPFLGCGQ